MLGLAIIAGGVVACGKKAEEQAVIPPEQEVLDPSVVEALEVEARQLEKILSGLKAKAYRGTRRGLVKAALGLIGAVEGQSAHPLMANLPEDVREVISRADGEAGALKALAEQPPAEVGLVVATGYLVHLQKTPALCELELIDPGGFKTPGGLSGFHVVRGVTYFMHGLKQHGLRDLRAANLGSAGQLAPEVRLAIYLGAAAAATAAEEPRMARTQLELAEELSPADPGIVFVRAEGEIAKRRYDEAAAMLGAWRDGHPQASGLVPGVIDARIAELGRGDASLTTVLAEPQWLLNFGLDYIHEQAANSEPFRKLDEVTGTARTMASDLLERFTGFGL